MPLNSRMFKGLAAVSFFALSTVAASAMQVDVLVDKVSQHMIVSVDGVPTYDWLVSSGAPTLGYDTPSGDYHVFRMEKEHFSKEWDDAPMPYSMFFTGLGHALHGSYHVKTLGFAVSHGCVRLLPANAAILFDLIQKAGFKNNTVSIRGPRPGLFQQPEALLTTEQTFHMTPKDHGARLASVAPASIVDQRPFWWQNPHLFQTQPVQPMQKKADVVKQDKTKKVLKKLAKRDIKKFKKGQEPKGPNFFNWLKPQSET